MLFRSTRDKLDANQIEIIQGDAASRIGLIEGAFDVVFLDPPYDDHLLPKFLPACQRLLTPDGFLYIESNLPFADFPLPAWLSGWQLVRADKAGAVHFALLSQQ